MTTRSIYLDGAGWNATRRDRWAKIVTEMDQPARSFAQLVEKSLGSPTGQQRLSRAHATLLNAFLMNKFNSERAQEVYTMAIEQSVLSSVSGSLGGKTIMSIRDFAIPSQFVSEIVEQFKSMAGATDQRRARKELLAKIIGK